MSRLLLLIPSSSYRAGDFLAAARRLDVDVVVGADLRQVLAPFIPGRTLELDFSDGDAALARIVGSNQPQNFAAIIGTDDASTLLAARAADALGLRHNSPASVAAAGDKFAFRQALATAGVPCPGFQLISSQGDLGAAAQAVPYPCVLKPRSLSASVGVIRADDADAFVAAAHRIAAILQGIVTFDDEAHRHSFLVEAFIPGREVALEGLLDDGGLTMLALFDKPDPLDGPWFEETIYVTPSRLPARAQQTIVAAVEQGAAALGLRQGPIHAELRLNDEGAWLVELAARSIGGLCGRALRFPRGASLEELILRQALDLPMGNLERETRASGVMMIPIPKAGLLRSVGGIEAARAVDGIDDIAITIAVGEQLVPLPEGGRYLGFIFAHAAEPDAVEAALRDAHARLHLTIEPERD